MEGMSKTLYRRPLPSETIASVPSWRAFGRTQKGALANELASHSPRGARAVGQAAIVITTVPRL
jgi:hypothetical protein